MKNLLSKVSTLSLGSLVGTISTVGLSVVLTRNIEVNDYGTLRQWLYIITMGSAVFAAGLPKIYFYYLPRIGIPEGKLLVRDLRYVSLLLAGILSLLIVAGKHFIASNLNNPNLEELIPYAAIAICFYLPTLGTESILLSNNKTKTSATFGVVSKLAIAILTVGSLKVLGWNVYSAVVGTIAGYVTIMIISRVLINFNYKDITSTRAYNISLKDIVFKSIPLMLSSLVGMGILGSNQFFISSKFGTNEFAYFANGFISIPILGIVIGSVNSVLSPIISKNYFKNEYKKIVDTWNNSVGAALYVVLPISMLIILSAEELCVFLYGLDYARSAAYLQLACVNTIFESLTFSAIYVGIGKTKEYFLIHTITFIVIVITQSTASILNVTDGTVFIKLYVAIMGIKSLCAIAFISRHLNTTFFEMVPWKQYMMGLFACFIGTIAFYLSEVFTSIHYYYLFRFLPIFSFVASIAFVYKIMGLDKLLYSQLSK